MKSIDVAVLIALEEEEKAFLGVFNETFQPITLEQLSAKSFAFTDANGATRQGVLISLGEQSEVRAAMLTERLLSQCQPAVVVSVGISGMLSGDCRLGDVVVPEKIDGYMFRARAQPRLGEKSADSFELVWGGRESQASLRVVQALSQLKAQTPQTIDAIERSATRDLADGVGQKLLANLRDRKLVGSGVRVHIGGTIAGGPILSASSAFKRQLLLRNRNYLAIDMESAAIGEVVCGRSRAPNFVVVRGVCDPGDEEKKVLEDASRGVFRSNAMRSASLTLQAILRVTEFNFEEVDFRSDEKTGEGSNGLIYKIQGLRSFHQQVLANSSKAGTIGHLYSLLCSDSSDQQSASDFLDRQIDLAIKARRTWGLGIFGRTGSGKTALLLALYSRAGRAAETHLAIGGVAFVDLASFASLGNAFAPARHLKAELLQVSKEPSLPSVLFVDGVAAGTVGVHQLVKVLAAIALLPNAKVITAARVEFDPQREFAKALLPGPEHILRIRGVPESDERCREVVAAFARTTFDIDQCTEIERGLLEAVNRSKLRHIDVLSLEVIAKGLEMQPDGTSAVDDCLSAFLNAELQSGEFTLDSLADAAFQRSIAKADATGRLTEGARLAHPFDGHRLIQAYLVSRAVVGALSTLARGDRLSDTQQLALRFVYPNEINRFCKLSLASLSDVEKQRLLEQFTRLFEEGTDDRTRAHLCYLLGRIGDKDSAIAREAVEFLREKKLELIESFDRDSSAWSKNKGRKEVEQLKRRRRLLLRTVHISLVQAGDQDVSDEYILRLIRRPQDDAINRGFHLEYYGDIKYDPSSDMSHADDLRPFGRTFTELTQKIMDALSNKRRYPLFDIDVYTLLSLGQHRHAAGKLVQDFRVAIAEVAHKTIEHLPPASKMILAYVQMVEYHLGQADFRPIKSLSEINNIKLISRSGWIKRGRKVDRPESVASHTWGAIWLALSMLPERLRIAGKPVSGYNKDRIVRMLAIHDLAESRVGDLLDGEVADKKIREEKFFLYINALQTYSAFNNEFSPLELWLEFEESKSICAQIAQDIDKLENLAQLQIYRSDPNSSIPDYGAWKEELILSMQTEVGKRIGKELLCL